MGTAIVSTVLMLVPFQVTVILLFIYLFLSSFLQDLRSNSASHSYTFDSLDQYSIYYPRPKYTFLFFQIQSANEYCKKLAIKQTHGQARQMPRRSLIKFNQ